MSDLLTTDKGFECVTCGHEWMADADGALANIRDANGNVLVDGDAVMIVKDLETNGKAGGIKVGTKISRSDWSQAITRSTPRSMDANS